MSPCVAMCRHSLPFSGVVVCGLEPVHTPALQVGGSEPQPEIKGLKGLRPRFRVRS